MSKAYLFFRAGNVGVGNQRPTKRLDVTGDAAISGALTVAGQTFSGSSTGTNTGDVTLAAVGSSPSANGASLSGQALTLQPADGTHPGAVTAGTQTIGGDKTFTGTTVVTGLQPVDNDGHILGASNKKWAWGYVSALRDGADNVRFGLAGSTGNTYKGAVPDGGSAVAHTFDNSVALSTSGAKLASFKSNNSEKFFIDKDGSLEFSDLATVSSVIIKSPDGTRYRIVVANGGALSTTAA